MQIRQKVANSSKKAGKRNDAPFQQTPQKVARIPEKRGKISKLVGTLLRNYGIAAKTVE